jgi:hypothetical protein
MRQVPADLGGMRGPAVDTGVQYGARFMDNQSVIAVQRR